MRLKNLILAAAMTATPLTLLTLGAQEAHAGVFIGVSVGYAPPVLPVYAQPPIPGPDYIWVPGYWAYGDAGYYWVPGYWALAPEPGLLWTPAWWGWEGGAYIFHAGYWGPHVGYYGGINYGFGYGGLGFCGGEWRGGRFFYNRAVVNVGGAHITNVYENRTIVNQTTIINNNHVSFNGGNGGVQARPTAEQQRFANERHIAPTNVQQQHQNFAAQDRSQLASVNGGRPATTAAVRPAAYQQVAQQHAQLQPISAQDRTQGKAFNPSNPNNRAANQDQRIANGVRSGQISAGQAAQDNRRQAQIDQQVRNDRAANGGTLTPQERQQVNREQNGASQQIYNQRHDGQNYPGAANSRADQRIANQDQRVANGIRDGQINAGQAAQDNRRQAQIDQQVHNDRTANGGYLNQQQRQQVNQEQNRQSQQIYNQRHDAPQPQYQQQRQQIQQAPRQQPQAPPQPRPQPQAAPRPAPQQAPREAPHEGRGGGRGR